MKIESVRRRLFFSQIHRVGKVVAASVLLGVGVAITAQAQVINLNPGDSVNLSQLLGPNADSVQVGDKLFANFSFQYGDTGGNLASYLQPNAISVTGLSNPTGYGISFSGPLAAIGDITKDLVLRYSVAVTDPTRLISDVHLSYNGTQRLFIRRRGDLHGRIWRAKDCAVGSLESRQSKPRFSGSRRPSPAPREIVCPEGHYVRRRRSG
jgi:hypothetical protein